MKAFNCASRHCGIVALCKSKMIDAVAYVYLTHVTESRFQSWDPRFAPDLGMQIEPPLATNTTDRH